MGSLPHPGYRHPLMRTGYTLLYKLHKRHCLAAWLVLFLVKKIIKAFFFCRLTGNFLHCCTLWFGWRFLNLFPYSVLSFCILDWIVSTHIKENVNSLVEPLQTKIHQHLKTSSSHLSTLALVSCHQWCVHGRWLENFPRSRRVFLQLICSCYLASFLLWPS